MPDPAPLAAPAIPSSAAAEPRPAGGQSGQTPDPFAGTVAQARPYPRWLGVPGLPQVEMSEEHDQDLCATATRVRTQVDGQEMRLTSLLSDEMARAAVEGVDLQVEHDTATLERVVAEANRLSAQTDHRPTTDLILDQANLDRLAAQGTPANIVARPNEEARVRITATREQAARLRHLPTGAYTWGDFSAATTLPAINIWNTSPASTTTLTTTLTSQALTFDRNYLDWQRAYQTYATTGSGNTIANTIANNFVYWQNHIVGSQQGFIYVPQRKLTVAERAVEQLRGLLQAAPEQAMRQQAEVLSEALLADLLGTEKYEYWRRYGVIHVTSKKFRAKIRYEIGYKRMIKLHEKTARGWRKRADQLCIHPLHDHPRGDEVAALYALASFDEDTLLKLANHHYRDQEQTPLEALAA
jgi:hypothetical protein